MAYTGGRIAGTSAAWDRQTTNRMHYEAAIASVVRLGSVGLTVAEIRGCPQLPAATHRSKRTYARND